MIVPYNFFESACTLLPNLPADIRLNCPCQSRLILMHVTAKLQGNRTANRCSFHWQNPQPSGRGSQAASRLRCSRQDRAGPARRSALAFDKERNVFGCPQGKLLHTTGKIHDGETVLYRERTYDCGPCLVKSKLLPEVARAQNPAQHLRRCPRYRPCTRWHRSLRAITP